MIAKGERYPPEQLTRLITKQTNTTMASLIENREEMQKAKEAIIDARIRATQPLRRVEYPCEFRPRSFMRSKFYSFDNGVCFGLLRRSSISWGEVYGCPIKDEEIVYVERAYFCGLVEDLELAEQGKQDLYVRYDQVEEYTLMQVTTSDDEQGHKATQEELSMIRIAVDKEMEEIKKKTRR